MESRSKNRFASGADVAVLYIVLIAGAYAFCRNALGDTNRALIATALFALPAFFAFRMSVRAFRKRSGGKRAQILAREVALDALLRQSPERALAQCVRCVGECRAEQGGVTPEGGRVQLMTPWLSAQRCRDGEGRALLALWQREPGARVSYDELLALWRAARRQGARTAYALSTARMDETAVSRASALREPGMLIWSGASLGALLVKYEPPGERQVLDYERKRTPEHRRAFLRALVTPGKVWRYALYGAGMLIIYWINGSPMYLAPAMVCLFLSVLCLRAKRRLEAPQGAVT